MSERRRAREASESMTETDELTVVVERQWPIEDRTVVVEREQRLSDETVAVDREPEPVTDQTVVVDRGGAPTDRPVAAHAAEPVSEATSREQPDEMDEATEVVPRPGSHPLIDEDTVVADRGGWLPEGTVRVGGPSSQGFSGPLGAGLGAAPAPVNRFAPPVAGRRAVLGSGAGSTSRYTTRRVVAPAPPAEAVAQAVDATRDHGAVLPSVRRRGRRGAIVSLASAGAALVVTIAGLAVVIPMLLAG